MTELVIMHDQQAVTTSLQIADSFGKDHKNVLKAIDDLKRGVAQNYATLFEEGEYVHPQNKQTYRKVFMNRDGFTLLAMGFTGDEALQFKLKYIDAFNKMEKSIQNNLQIPTNPMEALRLMFEAQDNQQVVLENHDERLTDLEINVALTPGEYNAIGRKVSSRVKSVIFERNIEGNKFQKSELFKAINNDICKITNVKTRSNLRRQHFDLVYDFILDWEPSGATMIILKSMNKEMEKEQ